MNLFKESDCELFKDGTYCVTKNYISLAQANRIFNERMKDGYCGIGNGAPTYITCQRTSLDTHKIYYIVEEIEKEITIDDFENVVRKFTELMSGKIAEPEWIDVYKEAKKLLEKKGNV